MHIPSLLVIGFVSGSDDAYCAAHDWLDCCNAFVAEAVEYGAYDGGANIAAGVGNGNDNGAFVGANDISCISKDGKYSKSVQTHEKCKMQIRIRDEVYSCAIYYAV